MRYLPIFNLHRRLEVRLLDGWLEDSSGYKVVDVGCGRMPYALKLPWASVTAMDMSVEAVTAAQRVTKHLGLDRTFAYVVGCATQVPLRDGSVDGVICNCVLEHIVEDGLALQEMHRVLKPDGFLFLTVDCDERQLALGWVERFPAWAKRLLLNAPVASGCTVKEGLLSHLDHRYEVVRRYSERMLGSDLEKQGFEVVNNSYYLVGLGAAVFEAAHAFKFMDVERGLSRMVYWFISVFAYPLVILTERGDRKGHGLAFLAVKKARE